MACLAESDRTSVRERISEARLYCVTCLPGPGRTYENMVESACKGGADVIQLRDKTLSGGNLLALARTLKKLCRAYGALFIVNDRVDIALSAGADGVHLGQDDLPIPEARRMARSFPAPSPQSPVPDFLIGCSTHSLDQALKAQAEGADYLGCGPVFATPTKPDCQAQGLELVRSYAGRVQVPFTAIGGIDQRNVEQVFEAGARCVAVVRAAFDGGDIESACRRLKERIRFFEKNRAG